MIKPDIFNIDTLAEKAGVSRRTIHYYLQRGLLMPPCGEGRGCHYTSEHLTRIKELQQLSAQGVPLARIKEYFEHGADLFKMSASIEPPPQSTTGPDIWERFGIAEGIEVHIRTNRLTERDKRELLKKLAATVKKQLSLEPKEAKS